MLFNTVSSSELIRSQLNTMISTTTFMRLGFEQKLPLILTSKSALFWLISMHSYTGEHSHFTR